jgi:hypothetical protein
MASRPQGPLPLLLAVLLLGGPREARGGEPRTGAAPAPPVPSLGIGPLDPWRSSDLDPRALLALEALGPVLLHTAPIRWGRVETGGTDAAGGPARDWEAVDEAFRTWQLAGLEVVPVLSPEHPASGQPLDKTHWARRVQEVLGPGEADAALRSGLGSAPPRPDAWGRFEDWVRAFVERYDGDGVDDAPGLRRPVRHVQLLERFDRPDAWLGSADEYLRLLHHAGAGAHAACETTILVTGAFDLEASGHDPEPDAEEWERRVAQRIPDLPAAARLEAGERFERIRRVLDMPRLYGAVAHVGSVHLEDDRANVAFLVRRLGPRGVRVWLVGGPPVRLGDARVAGASLPSAEERRRRERARTLRRTPSHPDAPAFAEARERGVAYDRARLFAVARGAGAAAVFLASPFEGDAACLRRAGEGADPEPTALGRVLAVLRERLDSADAQPLSRAGRVESVLFRRGVGPAFATLVFLDPADAWTDWPGVPGLRRETALSLPAGRYVVESLLGPASGARALEAREGVFPLAIGPEPLIVRPDESPSR